MKAGPKFGLIVAALLLPCCGGLALIGAFVDDPAGTGVSSADQPAAAGQLADLATVEPEITPAETATTSPAAHAATTAPTVAPTTVTPTTVAPTAAAPVVEKRTVKETKKVAYPTRRVEDDSLAEGTTRVRTTGVNGVRTLTYEIVVTDGVPTAKKLVRNEVTRKPVTKVVAVGTKVAEDDGGECHPNYSGCVPIASDVDCAGGSGNGPAYVSGPVRVTGDDVYDLDRDGDGTACD